MRKRIIDWIFTLQSQRGILGEKERRLYTYAYGLLLNKIAIYAIIAIVGTITGNWIGMFSFLLPFTILRQYAGGIHLEKPMNCIIFSGFLVFGCGQYLAVASDIGKILCALWVAAILLIFVLAPIDTKGKKLDKTAKKIYGRRARGVLVIEVMIAICFWVCGFIVVTKGIAIEAYGISAITPMGRADLEDKNNLLLKTLEQHERVGKVIENINTRYGKGFLYKIKDGNSNAKNCGAFTSNLSITPEGEIKFCAMDNQTVIKSLGNVFKEDIGQLFSNNYQLMNMIRGIQAPDYTSKECSGCEKKYFCSYCIIRGLVAAKEKGFENCAWYSQYIPNEFRRLLI